MIFSTVCTSVFEMGLIMYPRLTSDLESCCPSLLSAGNTECTNICELFVHFYQARLLVPVLLRHIYCHPWLIQNAYNQTTNKIGNCPNPRHNVYVVHAYVV